MFCFELWRLSLCAAHMFSVNKQSVQKDVELRLLRSSSRSLAKMFKQILRTSVLSKVVSLNRCLRHSSSFPWSDCDEPIQSVRKRINLRERIIDSVELDNLKEFRRSTLDRIDRLTYQGDHLIKSVHCCNSIQHLLTLIEQHLTTETDDADDSRPTPKIELRPEHLEMIYGKFRQLFCELKFRPDKRFVNEFYQTLNDSEFESFVHQTSGLIGSLSPACLIDVLYTVALILNQDPESAQLRAVIEQLNVKLNRLSLAEIVDCLEIIERYQIGPLEGDHQTDEKYLLQFKWNLLESARPRLMASSVDSLTLPLINRYLSIFHKPSNDPTYETLLYLVNTLGAPQVKIDFEQSVMLLRRIKTNHLFVRQYQDRVREDLFIKSMNRLIFKCNSTIFEQLSRRASREEFSLYLIKIHDFINPINYLFPDFYDCRLINLLAEFLVENLDSDANYRNLAYNLVHNYSKFYILDERLLKLLYTQCCETEKFLPRIAVSNFYYLFSKYRLPFVDHTLLATKLLLNPSDQHHFGTNQVMDYYKTNPLKILCHLILNDVTDERLLIYFSEATSKLDRTYCQQIPFSQFKELVLAKAHLNLSRLNIDLRGQIMAILERIMHQISMVRRRPNISYNFIRINSRLQSNAFLSNGIFIHPVAIYDRRIKNLVPLNDFRAFFEEFDRIPLTDNQEM